MPVAQENHPSAAHPISNNTQSQCLHILIMPASKTLLYMSTRADIDRLYIYAMNGRVHRLVPASKTSPYMSTQTDIDRLCICAMTTLVHRTVPASKTSFICQKALILFTLQLMSSIQLGIHRATV